MSYEAKGKTRHIPKRCARLGCSNTFIAVPAGKRTKKWCSSNCKRSAQRTKKTGWKPMGPGRKLNAVRCRKGHLREVWNTATVTSTKDGRQYRDCRECRAERNREYYARNAEKLREYARNRRLQHDAS